MTDPSAFLAHVLGLILRPHADGASRTYWLYIVSSLALAVVVYAHTVRARPELRKLASFLFPKQVWLHRSAITDYGFVAITALVGAACALLFERYGAERWLVGSAPQALDATHPIGVSIGVPIAYTICIALADDCRRYAVHRLFHRIPLLWEFHKVHHSAEVLTPVTRYRVHPIEDMLENLASLLTL